MLKFRVSALSVKTTSDLCSTWWEAFHRTRTDKYDRHLGFPLAGVPHGGGRGRLVFVLYMHFRSFVALSSFAGPPLRWQQCSAPHADGTGCWCNRSCDCHEPLGQTVRRSFQSSTHVGFLPIRQDEFIACPLLYCCAICWCYWRRLHCQIYPAPGSRQSRNKVRGNRARPSWQRSSLRGGTADQFCFDGNNTRCVQSRNACRLHTILGWFSVHDFHNPGSTAVRDEHESRQKSCSSIACELLACSLALLRRANSGHARCSRSLPACSRRCPSLLRKTASRQRQTMHLQSCNTGTVPKLSKRRE